VSLIVSAVGGLVGGFVGIIFAIVFGTNAAVAGAASSDQIQFVTFSVTTIVGALIGAITSIVSTAADSLIYIDLRIRKEGLDLDLQRFVEARSAGTPGVTDPYLARAPGHQAGPQEPSAVLDSPRA
ncbi:MAG: hypothetical protein JWM02_3608, partial [Frankiales bacterium]|nr:hypothetical protein [Frankiales bacterium]